MIKISIKVTDNEYTRLRADWEWQKKNVYFSNVSFQTYLRDKLTEDLSHPEDDKYFNLDV